MEDDWGTSPRPVRARRRERGAVSLDYLILGAVLIVIIGGLGLQTGVVDNLACNVKGLFSRASDGAGGSCGTDTVAGPGGDDQDATDDSADTPEQDTTIPPVTGGDNDGVGGNPPGRPDDGGGTPDNSDDDSESDPVGYDNANPDAPAGPFEQDNVDDGVDTFDDKLDGGWNGVRSGELEDIEDMLDGLSGPELDAVISEMSDDELEHWIDELDDGWVGSGWSRERRREMWNMIAGKASPETMARLAEFTDEVQPSFDDVGGDDAGDGTSPVDNAEYTEVPHELFVDGVDPHDINQGQIGDCWLIASIAAFANTNPDIITDAIEANDNGTYTVTLYDDGEPVQVTVTPDIPTVDGKPIFADNSTGDDTYELWPHLIEKAVAQYYGDYTDVEGDWPSKALELLTGSEVETNADSWVPFTSIDAPSVDSVSDTLADGGAVLVSTAHDNRNELYEDGTIVQGHAYYVYDVKEDGTVLLANPWGLDGNPPIELTAEEFQDSFIRYDVANPGK